MIDWLLTYIIFSPLNSQKKFPTKYILCIKRINNIYFSFHIWRYFFIFFKNTPFLHFLYVYNIDNDLYANNILFKSLSNSLIKKTPKFFLILLKKIMFYHFVFFFLFACNSLVTVYDVIARMYIIILCVGAQTVAYFNFPHDYIVKSIKFDHKKKKFTAYTCCTMYMFWI